MRAFWDASAIVPLCIPQQGAAKSRRLLRAHPMTVWWGSSVEVSGAIARLRRNGLLDGRQSDAALERLALLREGWLEVQPTERVRDLAERLLNRRPLRAADALQLAAALVWCQERPRSRKFLSRDQRLVEAARQEGFAVIES